MIEQLVSKVFEARNAAHLAHWAGGSYSEHVTLGEFCEKVIDILDQFVEAYQGAMDKLISVKTLEPGSIKGIVPIITQQAIWLNDNRDEICQGVTALENLYDGITGLYIQTLYKLKRLK